MSTGERLTLIATCVVLFAAGIVLATIEAFVVPVRLFGGVEGLSAVLALLVNPAIGLLAATGLRSTAGVAAPAAGWFAAASYATFATPNGSVVIPGTLGPDPGVPVVGLLWYFGGVVAFGAAILVSSARARTRHEGLHRAGERAEA